MEDRVEEGERGVEGGGEGEGGVRKKPGLMGIVGRSQDSAISQMTWGLLEGSEQKRDMLWLAFARISLPAL